LLPFLHPFTSQQNEWRTLVTGFPVPHFNLKRYGLFCTPCRMAPKSGLTPSSEKLCDVTIEWREKAERKIKKMDDVKILI
jgi:hypothetical protein